MIKLRASNNNSGFESIGEIDIPSEHLNDEEMSFIHTSNYPKKHFEED